MKKVLRTFRNAVEKVTTGKRKSLPVAGLHQPLSLEQLVSRAVRREVSEAAHSAGLETFDEYNDYSEDESDDFGTSPHEMVYNEQLGDFVMQKEQTRLADLEKEAHSQLSAAMKAERKAKQKNKVEGNPQPTPPKLAEN